MRPEEAVHALYVQRTRKLSLTEIDAQLVTLEKSSSFAAVFVREAMRAARKGEVQQHWAETLKALSRVGRQYSLGDQAFMATLDFPPAGLAARGVAGGRPAFPMRPSSRSQPSPAMGAKPRMTPWSRNSNVRARRRVIGR